MAARPSGQRRKLGLLDAIRGPRGKASPCSMCNSVLQSKLEAEKKTEKQKAAQKRKSDDEEKDEEAAGLNGQADELETDTKRKKEVGEKKDDVENSEKVKPTTASEDSDDSSDNEQPVATKATRKVNSLFDSLKNLFQLRKLLITSLDCAG